MTIFISGSTKGIGREIALTFAKKGYRVIINGSKDLDSFNNTLNEIKKYSPNSFGFICDVSDYNETQKMVNEINKKYEIDILINNSGISHIGLFTDENPEIWNRLIDVNVKSVFNLCNLVLPHMIKNHKGRIINISSVWGNAGASCEVTYSATKGAVNSFTKALAKEVAPSDICVNAISCGVIDTKMNSFLSEEERKQLEYEIPVGRFGKCEEVANLCLYLAQDSPQYLTGQIITLDGGLL